jgi:branched-chain amino acid transport system ATP-binding protein
MLLEVESVVKRFDGLVAVDGVDLEVPSGSIVGVVGPNGAGKSTLFNLISGQCKPTSGRILLQGKDIAGMKPHSIARLGVGRTFQRTTLFEELPVKINLAIAYRMRTRSGLWDSIFYLPRERREKKETALRVAETLGLVGLLELADKTAGNIPQVAKKKLAIGMALIGQPKIILLDEPTAGVGLNDVDELVELLEKVKELGIATCIIEHKMRMIMGLADHIVVLNFGEKIAEGTPGDVSCNPDVIEAYLGSGYRVRT